MPRPRSDEKRKAILEAATRIIVTEGLGAATADIARQAGVAHGSLFTYFETKAVLFNQLYLEIKGEIGATASAGLSPDAPREERFFRVWQNWTHWAVTYPEKRRALAQLSVSDEITAETREIGHKLMAGIAEIAADVRATGSMKTCPLPFVLALMNSVAETTMEFMTQDPTHAGKHCRSGFEALWRMLQ